MRGGFVPGVFLILHCRQHVIQKHGAGVTSLALGELLPLSLPRRLSVLLPGEDNCPAGCLWGWGCCTWWGSGVESCKHTREFLICRVNYMVDVAIKRHKQSETDSINYFSYYQQITGTFLPSRYVQQEGYVYKKKVHLIRCACIRACVRACVCILVVKVHCK